MRRALLSCALLLALALPALAAEQDDATAIARRVQKFYEQTQDLQASFEQTYTYKVLGKTRRSTGTLRLKKPGMMRWDYREPTAKHFIADGKTLWVYEPENAQAMVDRSFDRERLAVGMGFLWGEGDLTESFTVTRLTDQKYGKQGQPVLQLIPQRPGESQFNKVILVVDPTDSHVQEAIVFDPAGNTNRFVFSKVVTNTGIDEKVFQFKAPQGVQVVKMPKGE